MWKSIAIVLLALLPACAALNCYVCASGLTGCNDPFSATSANVTTLNSTLNTNCMKSAATSNLVIRSGAPTCTAIPFVFGIGTACCQTDLCNGASANSAVVALVLLSFFTLLFKLH